MKMQARPHLALAYLDRVATSAEDFHAGLNFAAVFGVPAVFVCVNDAAAGAAAAVPETMSETLAVKALAYGMRGVRVDGCDLFAVYAATAEAAERARAGRGPTFIEAVIAADDPLDRLRLWLTSQKLVDDAALRKEVEAEIAAALDAEAKVGPPPVHSMIEDVTPRRRRRWRRLCARLTTTRRDRADVHVHVDVHVDMLGVHAPVRA